MGDSQLDIIAQALAAGEEIDWEGATGNAASADTAAALRELRIVEAIATFHRSSGPPPGHAGIPNPPRDQWGELRIIRRIAAGSFGDVYEAYDPALARVVALKLIVPGEEAESRRDGVISEAQLLARVHHPNVVTVYGAGRVDGRTGISMELVRGRTLAEQFAASGSMNALDAARIARDLCAALAAVHAAGLVHRDVKAQNVMIEDDGRVVLMDLGAGFDPTIAAAPLLAGTPAYAAPEVLRGEPATPRSDLYSLGVLLQYLTTGTFPVCGASVSSMRADHDAGRRTPLPTRQFNLPRPFVSIVERALSPDASQRFESAEAMGRALEQVVSAPVRRRKWAIGAAVAAMLVALLLSVDIWQFRPVLRKIISPEASRLYFKGTVAASRGNREGWQDAIAYFQQAIDKDRNFAEAYSRMALYYQQLAFTGGVAPQQFMPQAEAAARKAIALDDTLAEAHAVLGAVLYRFEWDWSASEHEFRRALALNPNDAEGHRMFSVMLNATWRHEEALVEAHRSRDLDPLSLQVALNLGLAYREAGQDDLAIEEFLGSLKKDPNLAQAHFHLGNTYVEKGMFAEGIRELQTAAALSHRNPNWLSSLGYAYGRCGRATEAREILDELEALADRQYVAPSGIALIYVGLDDKQMAHAWLEKAFRERDTFLVLTGADIRLVKLRSDPDFRDVFPPVGLVRQR